MLVATLLAASTITFLLVAAMPGDPIRSVLKVHITPGQYAAMVHLYGLDLPLWQRYLRFMGGLLHGDFGLSLTQPGQRVTDLLAAGIPVSLTLGGLALALALSWWCPRGSTGGGTAPPLRRGSLAHGRDAFVAGRTHLCADPSDGRSLLDPPALAADRGSGATTAGWA